jgi:hypothetical protein
MPVGSVALATAVRVLVPVVVVVVWRDAFA